MTSRAEHKLAPQIWEIDRLTPYERNAKKHSDEQVETLAKAIQSLGWTAPIVVDKNGVIIAGHGRRLAALKLGLKKVPVLVRDDLTDDQVIALRLADNKVSSTDYDTNLLQLDLSDLHLADFDLSAIGFNEKELSFLIEDLAEMNGEALVEDITEAIETQKAEHEKAFKATDERPIPLAQAFGFKHVPGAKESVIARFMAQLEAETGLKGADALLHFVEGLQEAA
ncbi:ParB/Srx family N-terminal domain-containing protein [Magnetospirillum molischianum]|uniref:ParB-like N-terminal domain-containing protein n=1 Tax=Magnetospirillum molischianum DSM 120 TaxID=1150626 RepID=H8FY34_MAGML|nr:ParB/Srx family N-terminal domain-containing protein [Magnetospirillum molischianum]CCG43272.1 conserved hypothetical protein [Magnetospirillum molischianum DSM 120]